MNSSRMELLINLQKSNISASTVSISASQLLTKHPKNMKAKESPDNQRESSRLKAYSGIHVNYRQMIAGGTQFEVHTGKKLHI